MSLDNSHRYARYFRYNRQCAIQLESSATPGVHSVPAPAYQSCRPRVLNNPVAGVRIPVPVGETDAYSPIWLMWIVRMGGIRYGGRLSQREFPRPLCPLRGIRSRRPMI